MALPAYMHLMGFCAAGVVALTSLVNGHCITGRLLGRNAFFTTRLALSCVGGAAINTLVLLALASVGSFTPVAVALWSMLACFLVAMLCGMNRARFRESLALYRKPTMVECFTVAVIVGFGVFSAGIGSEEFQSQRDPGTYTTTALELARTGDLGWQDPLTQWVPMELARYFYDDLGDSMQGRPSHVFYPGFYLRTPGGHVEPQFLHAYEPWLALAYWARPSASSFIMCNIAWSMLFLLVFSAVALRLSNPLGGLVATTLLAANSAMLWYARTPSNEAMAMALLWGSLLVFLYAFSRRKQFLSVVGFALFLYFVAMVGKFSVWIFMPAIGFALGYYARRKGHSLLVPAVLLVLVQVAAMSYAAGGAYWYSWGSIYVSALKHGFKMWQVLGGFIAGAVLPYWCGVLWAQMRLTKRWDGEWAHRWRVWCTAPKWKEWQHVMFVVAGVFCVAIFYEYAEFPANALQGATDEMKWQNPLPLAQLGNYFHTVALLISILLIPYFFIGIKRHGKLLLLLVFATSIFLLFRSGIDAMHPWAVRRWLVVLIPALSLVLGVTLTLFSLQEKGLFARLYTFAIAVGLFLLVLFAQPAVSTTRQYAGLREAADRLAHRVAGADLVIAHPTRNVAMLSGYLWGEYGINMRVLQWDSFSWDMAVQTATAMHKAGKRVFYVADFHPFPEHLFPFMKPQGESEPFGWTLLEDNLLVPAKKTTTVAGKFRVWELQADKVPFGWSLPPKWKTQKLELLPPEFRPGVTTSTMELVEGGKPSQRFAFPGMWLNPKVHVNLGACLSAEDRPTTASGLSVWYRLSNGERAEAVGELRCDAYLDLGRNEVKHLQTQTVGANRVDGSLKIPFAYLREDSILTYMSECSDVKRAYLHEPQGVLFEMMSISYY